MGALSFGKKARDIWIADEAHELEGALQNAWAAEVSAPILENNIKQLKEFASGKKNASLISARAHTNLEKIAQKIGKNINDYFNEHAGKNSGDENITLKRIPKSLERDIRALGEYLHEANDGLSEREKQLQEDSLTPEISPLATAKNAGGIIKTILENLFQSINLEERVAYIQRGRRSAKGENHTLYNFPITVANELHANLPNTQLIAISATITINDSFELFARNLGFKQAIRPYTAFDAGTVFDYKKSGIIYYPGAGDFPEPNFQNREKHFEAFAKASQQVIEAANGGALVLCTTIREASAVAEYLRENLPEQNKVIAFDDAGTLDELITDFEEDFHSVLVGTKSFFQGIDVPGLSLRVICVNKIPFAPPNPITAAREEILRNQGVAGYQVFSLLSVAPAAWLLSQAAGRLIRHTNDKGVVAIFDSRLTTKAYGGNFLSAMPDFFRTNDFDLLLGAVERLMGE
jgi:Rad3-related DNA helicase